MLLAAACDGDERAFAALLERYRPELDEFCTLMLGDAEDAALACREAMLTAWRERGLAAPCCSVRMWLYRIVVRACLDALEI